MSYAFFLVMELGAQVRSPRPAPGSNSLQELCTPAGPALHPSPKYWLAPWLQEMASAQEAEAGAGIGLMHMDNEKLQNVYFS